MSAAAFAYVLLLRRTTASVELMTLLDSERRAEVQSVLDRVQGLPSEQIGAQLKELRDCQIMDQRKSVKERLGVEADKVAPKLYSWLSKPF